MLNQDSSLPSGEVVRADAATQHAALKPCPFCGSPAEYEFDEEINGHFIKCSAKFDVCRAGLLVNDFTKDGVSDLWNRRV